MQEIETRNPDGTFKQGISGNPSGTNSHLKGWQRVGTRLQKWYDTPREELERLVKSPQELDKLSGIDCACLRIVIGSIFGEDIIAHFNTAVDRIEGKAPQSVKHGGDPDNPSPINMSGVFTLTFGTDGNTSDKDSGSTET